MILDLHRHLQCHRLWHKASQFIAARLIADGDLDYRVVYIMYEGQRQGDSQLPLVDIKLFVESLEPMRCGWRERWGANDKSLARCNYDREWDKPLGDRLTIHVQASINVDVDRQPEPLEGAIGGRVKARRNLYALGLSAWGVSAGWGAVYETGQTNPPFQHRHACLALAIALLKALLQHVTLLVKEEHARIGHPPTLVAFGNAIGGMVLEDIFVEEAEFADHLAALIREEGVGDVLLGSKGGQYVHSIVADGKRHDTMALKVRQTLLQLDELRLAEGSPSGTAMKDH